MAVFLSPVGGVAAQFFNNSGVILSGGKLDTYLAGTTTRVATYTSSSGNTAHTNPIILDSAGRVPGGEIWLTTGVAYKFVLSTSADVLIGTYDNVFGGVDSASVIYQPAGTGAVTTTVQAKLRQTVSFQDYGAVGNGTTDDTAAVVSAINFANLNSCVLTGNNLNYLVQYGQLPAITKSNFVMANANFTGKVGTTGTLLTISGNYVTLRDVTIYGNMFAMTTNNGSNLIDLTGNNATFDNVELLQGTGVGLNTIGTTGHNFVNCTFNGNASLGLQTYTSSYMDFVNCTFNANGYGFKNTRPYPINQAPANTVGFGAAIRCTTHHVTFTNCQFNDNGRDGISVGQGSYSAKFTSCQALRNGDGGFTANADQTNTGLPGEGMSPSEIWYENCEAANSYASGIAAFCSVTGLMVIGGSYYNNHRLAGDQVEQASFLNGIYTAAGSTDVVIRGARCYDNRNLTTVPGGSVATGTGPYTLTVNYWVPGTMNYYPKIAFYGASGAFNGYGQLTAETANSVTFNVTAYNPVTPGSIGGGWYVTQRVQNNGVMVDNNCRGSIDAVCSGHLIGASNVSSFTGNDIVSGGFANGQNINLPNNIVDVTELLTNPTFDSNTTGWTGNTPGGGSFSVDTSIVRSPGSGKLVGGSSVAYADATLISDAAKYVQGSWVRFSAWVYSAPYAQAQITLFWGSYQTTANATIGESLWELLEITAFMPPGNTLLSARINVAAGVTAYYDNLSLRSIAPPRGGGNTGI